MHSYTSCVLISVRLHSLSFASCSLFTACAHSVSNPFFTYSEIFLRKEGDSTYIRTRPVYSFQSAYIRCRSHPAHFSLRALIPFRIPFFYLFRDFLRKEGDSNPRYLLGTHAFQACTLNHSDIFPMITKKARRFDEPFMRLTRFERATPTSAG